MRFQMLLLLATSVTLRAAPAWLQPQYPAATPGAAVVIELHVATAFGGEALSPAPLGEVRCVGRLAGTALEVRGPIGWPAECQFQTTVPRPGFAVLAADTAPRRVERAPADVERYLREIHGGADLREEWRAMAPSSRWRERVSEHARTFIRVGEPVEGDRGWRAPSGAGLELVPESDPTRLRPDAVLTVQLVRAGAPVPGVAVAFVSYGESREHVVTTDADGRAMAPLDASGWWLVQATQLRRVRSADHEWESEAVTLTVAVEATPR